MALHEVAVEPSVRPHRPFEVDAVALFQRAEVRLRERLLDGDDAERLGVVGDDCLTRAVDGDALIHPELGRERGGEREPPPAVEFFHRRDAADLFNYPCEHGGQRVDTNSEVTRIRPRGG